MADKLKLFAVSILIVVIILLLSCYCLVIVLLLSCYCLVIIKGIWQQCYLSSNYCFINI
jgi:hypothetical protein